ncbi:MAG TPA: outer membrane beta-barrel protein [Candidatus Aquilonibacter sp.]|nr:outer membrane beta-barrel protein [Candidatus Aquilonibacter sp.]
MKKLLGILALAALAAIPAKAQSWDTRGEVGGGYTFRMWNFDGSQYNSNGWNATVSYDVNRWLTAAADFDGTYSNQGENGSGWLETFMGGPRIYPIGHHKISPFVHALFGGDHASISVPDCDDEGDSCKYSDTTFAFEAGGGIDLNLTRHIAVRAIEADWEDTRVFGGFEIPAQNNFKYKAAILFKF